MVFNIVSVKKKNVFEVPNNIATNSCNWIRSSVSDTLLGVSVHRIK